MISKTPETYLLTSTNSIDKEAPTPWLRTQVDASQRRSSICRESLRDGSLLRAIYYIGLPGVCICMKAIAVFEREGGE